MRKFQTVRGMRDFLSRDAEKLRHVESTAKQVARLYCFDEVITPIVEHYDLLAAKSGEEITARMYAFKDLGGRKVALRPEFTASIARLIATALRNEPKPLRLFSTGSLYRYDEPQFGRYREFWQSNFEIIGSNRPEADVEILLLTNHLMKKLGLHSCLFKIGNVGILRGLLSEEGLNDEQQSMIMQLLDAKRWKQAIAAAKTLNVSEKGVEALNAILAAKGKNAPELIAQIKEKLKDYPASVKAAENLQQIVDVCKAVTEFDMLIDAGFARGLEYYTGMIFEVLVPQIDVSLGGGGRYDKLVEQFGGEPSPAVGVAHGLDRIALAMDKQDVVPKFPKRSVTVIPVEEKEVSKALETALRLRSEGIAVEVEIMGRSVSRALQDANRRKSIYTIILGPKELEEGKVMLRDMKNHQQQLIEVEDLLRKLVDEMS